jgi:mRNA-degrading endonuclease RelE of RelBE toxin-antitoxin system
VKRNQRNGQARIQYTLKFEALALEALEMLPKDVRKQIGFSIDLMQRDWTGNIKKLEGHKNEYRLRVGRFRVLVELIGRQINVYRKDVYGR